MKIIEIPAAKSAYLSEYYPDRSFPAGGSDHILFAGRYQQDRDRYRALLQFDLAEYPEIMTQQPALKAAYLQILVCRNEVPAGLARMRLHRVQIPWDENQTTWDCAPITEEYADYEFFMPSAWLGLIHVDITGLVRVWAEGLQPDYGLMVCGEERFNSLLAFPGSQFPNTRERPLLLICICEPHEAAEVSLPVLPGLLAKTLRKKEGINFIKCTVV